MLSRLYGTLRKFVAPSLSAVRPTHGETHQVENNTCYDRYPNLFSAVRDHCEDKPLARPVLSYGCSTGEECFCLHEKYLVDTPIIGLEVSKECLRACRLQKGRRPIQFLYSNESNLRKNAPYQAILCMSVFCRWPETRTMDDISGLYPFRGFDSTLAQLDSVLAVGGALVIYNANYRFCDSSIYSKYRALDVADADGSGYVHKFDARGRRLEDQGYSECFFIKVAD